MRIIAGKHRGRVLKTFKGTEIRPTSDRARQAFFNIFADKMSGASFLDGFAGTGAMGIEAISRGAKHVVFTDLKKASIDLINQNLAMIKENATVMVCDLLSYLKTTPLKFDFIFLDCNKAAYATLYPLLKDLLNEGGVIFADNILFRGYVSGEKESPKEHRTLVKKIDDYNRLVSVDKDMITSFFDVGDGIAVSVKKRNI